jgi:hypothetical protein
MKLSKRADIWGRPEYAKQWAKELGSGLFIHVAPYEDLKNIKNIQGEICVSSWDKTPQLFTDLPTAVGALFQGEATHYFPTDAGSIIDDERGNIRLTDITEVGVKNLARKYQDPDEAWLNPSVPENKLIGFLVLGPETDPQYSKYLKQAEELAKLNGVGVISMFGSPKKMEEVREKQEQKSPMPEPEGFEYRLSPKLKEYAGSRFLSKRAAMEQSSSSIGVSTTARLRWREYYSKHNVPNMALMDNKTLNETIGSDAKSAKVIHRFRLKDKSIGEFRKSHAFYYLLKYTGGGNYVVLTIQPSYKETTPEISKQRLTPEWLERK